MGACLSRPDGGPSPAPSHAPAAATVKAQSQSQPDAQQSASIDQVAVLRVSDPSQNSEHAAAQPSGPDSAPKAVSGLALSQKEANGNSQAAEVMHTANDSENKDAFTTPQNSLEKPLGSQGHSPQDYSHAKSSDPAMLAPPKANSNEDGVVSNMSAMTTTSQGSTNPVSTWDKAKMLFSLMRAEELLNDLHDLKYIGAGGYGKVFKAVWRSAPVAVKLVPSHSPELFKSSSYKEALLCKELCHPNIVQTYETRCAQLTEEFVHMILVATETPLAHMQNGGGAGVPGASASMAHSYGSQEFVSGDGFGLPSPVPDMVVQGRTLPEAAAKWKDILFTTGANTGDFLTVIIMDFCDYGSLVRPIVKGMFRPFSASGSDREARVRYRALLRTAKEIAQGLEHLHHLRVVHGDLKPGNVLLKGSRVDVRGFNAQVIDFGLSHMVANSNPQKVSKAGGTLVYAAPEVFGGRVGKAADVYSLGIILWEMVTGSQPYKDLVEGQIVLGVQKGGLRPAWPPGQLPQLQELYEKCVAQDPDSRPKAKEVVQFLTQIEMDLRAELRAAHKQMQQAQMMTTQQQQQMALMQQQAAQAALQQQQQLEAEQHQRMLAAQQQQQQQQVGK